jgi:hypothetical protein
MSKCFQNLSDLKLNVIVTKIVVGRGEPVVRKDVLAVMGSSLALCSLILQARPLMQMVDQERRVASLALEHVWDMLVEWLVEVTAVWEHDGVWTEWQLLGPEITARLSCQQMLAIERKVWVLYIDLVCFDHKGIEAQLGVNHFLNHRWFWILITNY